MSAARWAEPNWKSWRRKRIARRSKTPWRTWPKPSLIRARRASRKRPRGARRFGCGSIPFPTFRPRFTILRIEGAMLEPKQILELARLIEEAGEIRAALNLAGEKYPRLAAQMAGNRRSAAHSARCARQDSSRWHRGRRRQRGSASSAPRHRTAAEADPDVARTILARRIATTARCRRSSSRCGTIASWSRWSPGSSAKSTA